MKKTPNSKKQNTSSRGSSKVKTGSASKGTTTKKPKEESKSKSTGRKMSTTVWGKSGTKSERKKFEAYLEQLTTAKDITSKGRAGVAWLKKLPRRKREQILERLREVDTQGHAEVISLIRSHARLTKEGQRERTKELPVAIDVNADIIGIEQEIAEVPAASSVRFVSAQGIRHVAAICLASGYKRKETAAILGIELGELNMMVSNEDVKSAVKDVDRAVITAADQRVLRDLLAGVITDDTNRADLIASRRKKLTLDASAEARNIVKDSEELQRKREQYINKRFGIKETGDEGTVG